MFALTDSWVWDMWFADDGDLYHMFFLYASKALHDPDARHYRASIGHAVSCDLISWRRTEDALVRADTGFDDLATWTGSVVQGPDGVWHMFYTGATLAPDGRNVQSIGHATSADLIEWHRAIGNPVAMADARWYETIETSDWNDEAFRDPWVFKGDDGLWHMLITARANHGPRLERGVMGHAVSSDLDTWTVMPPLSEPEFGFGQLEVTQPVCVDGHHALIFSCLAGESTPDRAKLHGGVWAAPADGPLGRFDLTCARPLTGEDRYAGRLLQRRDDGRWYLFAFQNVGPDGGFAGIIGDPLPVRWLDDGLVVDGESS